MAILAPEMTYTPKKGTAGGAVPVVGQWVLFHCEFRYLGANFHDVEAWRNGDCCAGGF